MVSFKCLALLVLIANLTVGPTNCCKHKASSASVHANYDKDPTPIIKLHQEFYTKYAISLEAVLNAVGNLLGSVLKLVGLVLQTVGNVVGGLLGFLGVTLKKVNNLEQFLLKPKTEADVINFLIRVIIVQQAVFEKINKGFGDLYARVGVGSIILSLSARGKHYEGLSIKMLSGDKAQWMKKCKLETIEKDWKTHCDKLGGLENMTGVKAAIYWKVNALITLITSGVSVLTEKLFDDVMAILIPIIVLVGNVMGGLVTEILGVLIEYTSSLFIYLDVSVVKSDAESFGSQYSTESYDECFTNK